MGKTMYQGKSGRIETQDWTRVLRYKKDPAWLPPGKGGGGPSGEHQASLFQGGPPGQKVHRGRRTSDISLGGINS